MSVSLVEHVSALTTANGCIKHVSVLTTMDGCVCVSGETCQCSNHCGLVCLCLWWNISVPLSLWMGVSVSLVEHVSALTTVDGCICISGAICQCSDHSGWMFLYLWCNMAVL